MKKTNLFIKMITIALIMSLLNGMSTAMTLTVHASNGNLAPTATADEARLWGETTPANNMPTEITELKPTDELNGEYAFGARFIPGVTTIEYGDTTPVPADFPSDFEKRFTYKTITSLTSKQSIVDNVWWRYHNVGTYQGKIVDVKVSVNDYHLFNREGLGQSAGWIIGQGTSTANAINFGIRGFDWVDFKFEYFEHKTNNRINVKSTVFFQDIDVAQSMAIIDNNPNKLFVSDGSYLRVLKQNINGVERNIFTSSNAWSYPLTSEEHANLRQDAVAVEWSGNTQLQRFYCARALYPSEDAVKGDYLPDNPDIYKMGVSYGMDMFAYSGNEISRTSVAPLSKAVSDNDEKLDDYANRDDITQNTIGSFGEVYKYTLSHVVPQEYLASNRYASYVVTDELEVCLQYQEGTAKVFDEANTDVTDLFTVNVAEDGKEITFTLRDPSRASFYYSEYSYEFDVKVRDEYDMTPYIIEEGDQEKVYSVRNAAKVVIERDGRTEEKVSNETKTNIINAIEITPTPIPAMTLTPTPMLTIEPTPMQTQAPTPTPTPILTSNPTVTPTPKAEATSAPNPATTSVAKMQISTVQAPKTGDNTEVSILFILGGTSLLGIVSVLVYAKRKKARAK